MTAPNRNTLWARVLVDEGPDGEQWRATPMGNRIAEQIWELSEEEWRF